MSPFWSLVRRDLRLAWSSGLWLPVVFFLLVASLTAGLPRAGALAGLLMLPLAVPVLIFGAGSLAAGSGAAIKLLAASSLFIVALVPFAAGAAIRAGRR